MFALMITSLGVQIRNVETAHPELDPLTREKVRNAAAAHNSLIFNGFPIPLNRFNLRLSDRQSLQSQQISYGHQRKSAEP